MTRFVALSAFAALLVVGVACDRPAVRETPRTPVRAAALPATQAPAVASLPLPSAAEAAGDPRAAFARYLAFSMFQGAPPGPDSLPDCDPLDTSGESQEGWEPDDYIGFVNPVLLSVTRDTGAAAARSAVGIAAVRVVAHFQRDSVNWVGTLQGGADTLGFTLLRGAGGWSICGPAVPPRSTAFSSAYFPVTLEDARRTETNSARWLPAGTTWENVARRVDSIARLPAP